MGRYDHLKKQEKEYIFARLKLVRKVSVVLAVLLVSIGILIQLVIYLKK